MMAVPAGSHAPADTFADRHVGPRDGEVAAMLSVVGADSLDELIDAIVPPSIRSGEALDLPPALSEPQALERLAGYAAQNTVATSMIGMGYHGTHTPAVILRNVMENPAWYTAYTPYQPEISQGRLEALLNFQTMIADLAGLDLANASLLDEATAAAEAMTMARRTVRHDGGAFFVDHDTHPQTLDVIRTRAEPLGIEVVVGDPEVDLDPDRCFGALVSYPASSGAVRDLAPIAARLHDAGGFVVVASDPLSLMLLEGPGHLGADAVVGSAQRFGVPLGFGGPHAGFMATREEHKRSLPGRLVGVSIDSAGRRALRLALQTREQHIRREKATSNICTAQVLLAVMASMYAVYHGPEGLRAIATRVHALTSRFVAALRGGGLDVTSDTWFDTVTVSVPGRAAAVLSAAVEAGINLRPVDDDHVGVSFDETHDETLLARLVGAFGLSDHATSDADAPTGIPEALRRRSEVLTADVFGEHRSETEMMRYLRRLADRDVALDRSMIPLGSCTMKLNAATEMIPVTWPGFADLHPFAPHDQTEGYHRLFADLEAWLATITGYHAVSLQPNAGSQGEYAGLMAIRAYHRSRGDDDRTVCLIPASAHGTNAASAVMAGMDVVVVDCDDSGNVDLADLTAKAERHGPRLGALMVTYPSTHGVFEEAIGDICALVHDHGGQVYLDGANMNALVGLARPGRFGSDVSHLNLHKTFCIPHGGGGPGVGPIGVAEHLAPFLPGHRELGEHESIGAVAAAPWGSASILPISWAYIAMMGPDGLRRATEIAILSANYVARRLADHYPILYSGRGGYVAHEAILDIRPIEKATGIGCEDIAKRLIDYGFHAPTMSFPVAGTLMVEPTESESKAELDRFCDAMIAIRGEIAAIERGEVSAEDSVLRHAPHPAETCTADRWDRAYSRETAAFPLPSLRGDKYWVPVGRIDNGYGDRNLVCSCPPPEAFETEFVDTL